MGLRLKNSSGNYVELNAPSSIATNFGLTLPVNDGDSGQYLQTNGTGTLSWQTLPAAGLQWSENQVSLSGTGQLWTGIPSDAVQIMIAHNGWSQDASASQLIEIGDSGGLETAGYNQGQGTFGASSTGSGNASNANWGNSNYNAASNALTGLIVLTRVGTTNEWCCQWFFNNISGTSGFTIGNKTLSGTLDRVQIRPASGSFDAGTASLVYLT
jgi:hypothetical protein